MSKTGGRVSFVFLLGLVGAGLLLIARGRSAERFPRGWLETVEELSESLANDLLDLSVAVRDRDLEAGARFVANRVRAHPLPSEPSGVEPVVKWIGKHGWAVPAGEPGELDREVFVASLARLLDHFGEIEDARFKVKGAEFDPATPGRGRAQVAFFLVGRDREGRREWLQARLTVGAERTEGEPWRIRTVEIASFKSTVASEDLFSEATLPAGLSVLLPPFGSGANQGFVYHGAAVADVNDDGLLDVAATGMDRNYLYVNAGDGRFHDASAESLVKFAPPGTGALFIDHDNDGDADLFLAAVGRQVLLENRLRPEGRLRFEDVSEKAGVAVHAVGFSAAAADVNRDGWTDLYVASYNRYGVVMPDSWERATNGTPNLLLLNRGDGTFREAAREWGVDDGRWSYAAAFADVDEDGDLDLFVANDFGEDALYRNEGGRFTDVAADRGVRDPGFGMGVAFGDYDNDGDLDLHVTNMSSTAGNRILKRLYGERPGEKQVLVDQAAGNSLYENLGGGRFRNASAEAGGFPAGWAYGGGFLDLDNDGWEDLYSPNGFISGKTMKDT